MLEIGAILDNKYKSLNEIGRGGMSVVYLAINERANKTWAVKEVRKDGVSNFEAVKQGLVVETNMLKKFNHSNLPSIIDVIDQEDSFIIVMDYIEGESLQKVVKNGGAQPQELVVKWGIQLCDVLGYLHSQNPPIIYRDMKPANVMLKPDGNVTLIDFGTAREFKNKSMVEDTTCLGPRGYAAPEQFGGHGQTDARTDIYCLGATLYHLLTGHSPAEPPYEIKPLSYWIPAYAGSGMEKIVNKCCQQDPSARYQNCDELMYDLEHVSDFDDVVIRTRKLKWAAFLTSVFICLAGILGAVGFTLAKQNVSKSTYDYYVLQAEVNQSDFDEAIRNLKYALKVAPGRADAYETLLDIVEQDGRLTSGEVMVIREILQAPSGNQTNETLLRAENPEEYAKIEYRIGRLYFLMYDDSARSIEISGQHFKNALDVGMLEPASSRLAESLYKIATYSDSLEANLYTDSEYSYTDLWMDMQEIVDDQTISALNRNSYRISVYNKVAYMLRETYEKLDGVGISVDEMTRELEHIRQGLNDLNISSNEAMLGLEENRAAALQSVENAQQQITSYAGKKARNGG